MNTTFRIKLRDKLSHVVSEVQRGVEQLDHVSEHLTLPNHVELKAVDVDVIKSLGFVLSEVLTKDVICCQLRVKLIGTTMMLYGASFKHWESPVSGSLQDACWRVFGIPLIKMKNQNIGIPAQFNKIQHIALNINYIQQELSGVWCDFMTRFPPGCQELKNVRVPGWMNEDDFQLLIKKTIEYNKVIKLEDRANKKLFTKDEGRSVKFCPADQQELVPLSSLCAAFDNLKCEEGGMDNPGSGKRHYENCARENFWGHRQESRAADAFAGSNIDKAREQHILDQEVPDHLLRDPRLLPRSPLRPPTQSSTTARASSPPTSRIGPRLVEALKAAYPHLAGTDLLNAAQAANNSGSPFKFGNLDSSDIPAGGFSFRKGPEPNHFSQPGHDQLGLGPNHFGQPARAGVTQEVGYNKQLSFPTGQMNRSEGFAGAAQGNSYPAPRNENLLVAEPGHGRPRHAFRNDNLTSSGAGENLSNEMSNFIGTRNIKSNPVLSNHSVPEKQLNIDLNFNLPKRQPRYSDQMGHVYEKINEEPQQASAVVNTSNFHLPPNHHGQAKEPAEDWHGRQYLGPAFPSLERELQERRPRDLRMEQQELQQELQAALQNVHNLEQDINQRIYGAAKQAPVSLLENDQVIYATENPSLLAPDTRSQIAVMRDVLKLMNDVKEHHHDILSKLDDEAPDARRSSRLQNKDKVDYKRLDRGY